MEQDGHHAITRKAVERLFAERADMDGRIRGLTEEQYYEVLDRAQAYQDRLWGPTIHPASMNPDAQREHAMADPYRSGPRTSP